MVWLTVVPNNWKHKIVTVVASRVIYTRVSVSISSLAHAHPVHPAHPHSLFFIFTRQPLLLIVHKLQR
jgi:hypothetical protein